MTVYVVDDDSSIRQAVSGLLRSAGLNVDTFGSAQEFLSAPRADAPSCLVLDVRLPDGSGLDLPDELRHMDVPLPIIFITGHGTIPMSVRAMKSGALEFLTKPFRDEELLGAINVALENDRLARAERSLLAEARRRIERLTPRERQVLDLVVAGKMNKQIAASLGTAEQTVKQHRGRVMKKLEVDSVADLVRIVERASGQPASASTAHPA
ncbi:MAG TPA: response regulator [Gemmatimonadaceae bacterium]|jgi:FixJ family two-component response regulator